MNVPPRFWFCFALLLTLIVGRTDAGSFSLEDGDRVVLIGDGLIEQEQYFGWMETMLTASFPEADATFRNLGWNGDTPAGVSRFGLSLLQAGREPSDEGWKQLQKQIELTRPTVAVIGYGMSNALEASDKDTFTNHYKRLIRRIQQETPDCRFVLLSPISPHGASSITPQTIDDYASWIRAIAGDQHHFIDLTKVALDDSQRKDAVHLNGEGYRQAAIAISKSLGVPSSSWQTNEQTDRLRRLILEKSRLWFHRSRPANMAYVFGFRKHEQGQNAVEIPQYDPLIEAEEKKIAALRSLTGIPATDEPATQESPSTQSRYAKFTPQPTPNFVVADGLEVSLWAENPLLNKPIQMNFDAAGRLWVASSEAYPMIEVGQALPDKILILQDTTGDGKADKSSVFADQLLIPTGVTPGDGGVYVAQSTDLLFLKDTDGDGKADTRRRVLSGFGTEDTHHNLHTLAFGPDGRLYMNQSVYTRTDTETPHGVVRLKAGGGFRYDTKHDRMDVFFHGLWNPWGHQFDQYGNSFMTDGAGFAGIAYVFPGATFNPTPGANKVLGLISPGSYPKFCGGEIIRGESFPDDWQGSYVTCDFRANRVTRFSFSDSDSGFVTNQEKDLIRTSESTFRPIDVKMGPDGALYVADWSNPIINHGEVDFRDPRRDRWHGRIWRITATQQPLRSPSDLTKLSTESLAAHLFSDDQYLSPQARRVLIERSSETASKLDALWKLVNSQTDRLEMIRLSAAVGKPNRNWLMQSLESDDRNARAASTRILADWSDPTDPTATIPADEALVLLKRRIGDSSSRCRLEAIRALARLNRVDAIKTSLLALNSPVDRFIDHALMLNVTHAADDLMADLQNQSEGQLFDAKTLEFILTTVRPNQAKQFLAGYLNRNKIARDGSGPWIGLIAKAGAPEQLAMLFSQVTSGGFEEEATARSLDALADAKKFRKVMPKFSAKPAPELKRLITGADPAVRNAAIRLVGAWQLRGLVPVLAKIANESDVSPSTSQSIITAFRSCGGKAATDALRSLVDVEGDIPKQTSIIGALAAMDAGSAVEPFYALIRVVPDEQQALTLWRSMLGAKDGEKLLVASMPKDGIPQLAARAGVRAAGEADRNAKQLAEALIPMSGMAMTAAQWTPERARELRRLTEMRGDAARGELVYRRSQLQCATCHAIGGVGGKVGPDMTSLGASAPIDYIIESLFNPNAKIKENYHSVTVLTEEGQVFAGIEFGSTDDEMILRDASNKMIRIPQAEVVQVKQGKSLMPDGLLDRVPQSDQLDLIRFLTRLGKPGDYDASRQTVARVLEVFAGTHRIEQAGNDDIVSGADIKGWKPLQARVSGKIDREVLQKLTAQPVNISLVNIYLRTQVEVGSDTDATIQIDNLDSAKVWIDGELAGSIDGPVTVPAGKHTLLIQIDGRDLPESITIRSEQLTFTSG